MDAKELTKIVNDHSNRLREDEKRIDYLEQEVQKLRMLLDDLRVEVAMCTHNIGRGAEDMRYILNIDDRTGEATIHPYEAGEVFKRGYDMGEAQGRRSANGVEAAEVEKAVEVNVLNKWQKTMVWLGSAALLIVAALGLPKLLKLILKLLKRD